MGVEVALALSAPSQIAAVLIPPFGAATWLEHRGVPRVLATAAGLTFAPATAMAVLWLAWLTMPARLPAELAGWAVLAIGASLALLTVARGQWWGEIAGCFVAAACAALILVAWPYFGHHVTAQRVLGIPAGRWTHPLPPDNEIPLDFARGLFAGHIPTPLLGDWLSSDRPPLQTALYLITPDWLLHGPREIGYQPAAVAMQMTVLVGAWVLLRALGVTHRLAMAGLLAVFFTPLVIVNGAYVWPKLLPAGFLLAAAAVHFTTTYESVRGSWRGGAVVGALYALAMLAHGGSAFTIAGSLLAAVLLRRLGGWRYVSAAVLAGVLLYTPWIGYQKFVDPPGDRLLKWHLAGVSAVDPRSFSQTILDGYEAVTFRQVVEVRESNFKFLFLHVGTTYARTLKAAKDMLILVPGSVEQVLHQIRIDQFFCFVAGSGFFGLGLYLLPLAWLDRTLRPLTLAVMLTLLVWIGLMFQPSAAAIHQGSLFPEIAIIVAVIAAMSPWPRLLLRMVAIHASITAFQYLF